MRRDDEEVKPFNINVYIQLGIGLVITAFISWVGSTLWDYQISKSNQSHLNAKFEDLNKQFGGLSTKIENINNKLVTIEQESLLMKQNLKYLNNQRQDMKGMAKREEQDGTIHPPMISNPFLKENIQKASTVCEGDECTQPPVDPPKPKPTKPHPAMQ